VLCSTPRSPPGVRAAACERTSPAQSIPCPRFSCIDLMHSISERCGEGEEPVTRELALPLRRRWGSVRWPKTDSLAGHLTGWPTRRSAAGTGSPARPPSHSSSPPLPLRLSSSRSASHPSPRHDTSSVLFAYDLTIGSSLLARSSDRPVPKVPHSVPPLLPWRTSSMS